MANLETGAAPAARHANYTMCSNRLKQRDSGYAEQRRKEHCDNRQHAVRLPAFLEHCEDARRLLGGDLLVQGLMQQAR
jgi:hypothetical protein